MHYFLEVNLENISQQDIMLPSSIRKKHLKISVLDENNSNIINNLKKIICFRV